MAKNTLKMTDLRTMSPADLQTQLNSSKEEMVEKRRSLHAGELANPRSISRIRQTIARINTVISEQEAAKTQEEK